ncbi:MAG: hypothetical protein NVSMB57_15520 [Actinomycetota bacterium]
MPFAPITYQYRNKGTLLDNGTGNDIPFPPQQTRTVQNVKDIGSGNYEFDVATLLLDVTTTTTFRVVNGGTTPDRGIYIVQVVSKFADARTEAFTPDQPILLMKFPPQEFGTNLEDSLNRQKGSAYESTGTDPLSQTTMLLQATIVGKQRVNACGTWVDSYDVQVLTGKILSPTKNIDFKGHFYVAPQYGGLIVQDDLTFQGTDGTRHVRNSNVSSINIVPHDPR